MSYETDRTEVESWWDSELSQVEELGMIETVCGSVGYIRNHDFGSNPGRSRHYKKKAKIQDEYGDTTVAINLWWANHPSESGSGKIRIDEKMPGVEEDIPDVENDRNRTSVWRRTDIEVDPSHTPNPISVKQRYGLKRRASKDFRQPRNQREEELMKEYSEIRESGPLQVDRILAESALYAMATQVEEKASDAEGDT